MKTIIIAISMSFFGGFNLQEGSPIVNPGAPGEDSRRITAEESLAMGNTRFTFDDVTFMQHMILHHAQAVEMVALIEERSDHEGVTLLGKRISMTQDAEIMMMEKWLTKRGQKTEADMGHGGHSMGQMANKEDQMSHGDMLSDKPIMVGMLSPAQMMELKMSDGEKFDRLFLEGMIQHHEGALFMVKELVSKGGNGQDPEISNFLAAINADQSTEILRMKNMLRNLN